MLEAGLPSRPDVGRLGQERIWADHRYLLERIAHGNPACLKRGSPAGPMLPVGAGTPPGRSSIFTRTNSPWQSGMVEAGLPSRPDVGRLGQERLWADHQYLFQRIT